MCKKLFLCMGILLIAFSAYSLDQPQYGTFTPKIGDINKAVENYDYNSKSKLTGLNIDTNIPSKLYCGEQFEFWVQITGNYEDEKGNIYKRKIVNPDVMIDAPDIIMNKKYSYGGKYECAPRKDCDNHSVKIGTGQRSAASPERNSANREVTN